MTKMIDNFIAKHFPRFDAWSRKPRFTLTQIIIGLIIFGAIVLPLIDHYHPACQNFNKFGTIHNPLDGRDPIAQITINRLAKLTKGDSPFVVRRNYIYQNLLTDTDLQAMFKLEYQLTKKLEGQAQ